MKAYAMNSNAVIIRTEDGNVLLQSYDSLVVTVGTDGIIRLHPDWDYSRTTMKHVRRFLESEMPYSISAIIKSNSLRDAIKLLEKMGRIAYV